MARISNVFSGSALSSLILYRKTEKDFIHNMQQTPVNKTRRENFGIASSAAKTLRCGLNAVIPFSADRNMQSRFSGAMVKLLGCADVHKLSALNCGSALNNFQFSQNVSFAERFKTKIIVNQSGNILTVKVDAFIPMDHIVAPETTVFTELVISVAGCVLENGTTTISETQRIQTPYNYDEISAQTLSFNIPWHEGSLTIVAAALQYYIMKKNGICLTSDENFMPAAIINANYK